jgi:hypothetical protein
LLNVATLDERVADATIGTESSKDELALASKSEVDNMRRCGMFPFYSFDRADRRSFTDDVSFVTKMIKPQASNAAQSKVRLEDVIRKRFITPNLTKWLTEPVLMLNTVPQKRKRFCEYIQMEGIRFGGASDCHLKHMRQTEPYCDEKPQMDAVIVHEGITDALHANKLWDKGDHRWLYSRVPAIVRTSGRGRESRQLGDELPFIELNVLSDSCYGSRNKIRLARAVLGASGEEAKEQ